LERCQAWIDRLRQSAVAGDDLPHEKPPHY
jgi:hypothetical protein